MKTLTVDVVANAYTREESLIGCRPPVIVSRTFEVIITFTLKLNGKKSRGLVVTMDASDRGQGDEQLREELIYSKRAERQFHAEAIDEHDDPLDDWTIEILDPTGILKWFGLDNAVEIFKQHPKNDQPVRLPAPH
jgi:hypothetical protein